MCAKTRFWELLSKQVRTVRTEKPNHPKPEPYDRNLLEPIETGTESCLKFRTGTEEFWNRPSTNVEPYMKV